jgi:hypothetical protein
MRLARSVSLIALVGAAFTLTACVGMSRSSAVTAMDPTMAAGARVSEIRLTTDDKVTVRPEFAGIFREHVQTKLDGCATGTRPLRLEASISRFDRANPAQVLLIGGANVLRGHARLVDPTNGRVVAEYDIGRTIVGGRLGVFQMAESEEQLSDAFGSELCDQAFKPG